MQNCCMMFHFTSIFRAFRLTCFIPNTGIPPQTTKFCIFSKMNNSYLKVTETKKVNMNKKMIVTKSNGRRRRTRNNSNNRRMMVTKSNKWKKVKITVLCDALPLLLSSASFNVVAIDTTYFVTAFACKFLSQLRWDLIQLL